MKNILFLSIILLSTSSLNAVIIENDSDELIHYEIQSHANFYTSHAIEYDASLQPEQKETVDLQSAFQDYKEAIGNTDESVGIHFHGYASHAPIYDCLPDLTITKDTNIINANGVTVKFDNNSCQVVK